MSASTRTEDGQGIENLSLHDRLTFNPDKVNPFGGVHGRLISAGRVNIEEVASSKSLVVKVLIPGNFQPSTTVTSKNPEQPFRSAVLGYLNHNNYFVVVSGCDLDGRRGVPYIDGDLYLRADSISDE